MKYKIVRQGKTKITGISISTLRDGVYFLHVKTEQKHFEYVLGSCSTRDTEYLTFCFYEDANEDDNWTEILVEWKGTPIRAVFEQRYGLEVIVIDYCVFMGCENYTELQEDKG